MGRVDHLRVSIARVEDIVHLDLVQFASHEHVNHRIVQRNLDYDILDPGHCLLQPVLLARLVLLVVLAINAEILEIHAVNRGANGRMAQAR